MISCNNSPFSYLPHFIESFKTLLSHLSWCVFCNISWNFLKVLKLNEKAWKSSEIYQATLTKWNSCRNGFQILEKKTWKKASLRLVSYNANTDVVPSQLDIGRISQREITKFMEFPEKSIWIILMQIFFVQLLFQTTKLKEMFGRQFYLIILFLSKNYWRLNTAKFLSVF